MTSNVEELMEEEIPELDSSVECDANNQKNLSKCRIPRMLRNKKPDLIDLTGDCDETNSNSDSFTIGDGSDPVPRPVFGKGTRMKNAPTKFDYEENSDSSGDLIEVPIMSKQKVAEDRRKFGNELFKRGEYLKAIDLYTQAIEFDPEKAEYYGNRSAAYMMIKRFKDALKDARISLQKDSTFPKGWSRVVKATLELGDIGACENAIVNLSAYGIDIDLSKEKASLNSLKELLKLIEEAKLEKDYYKVLLYADRATSIARGDSSMKTTKAEALIHLDRYPEASSFLMDLLRSEPNCVEAMYLKAVCFYMSDSLDKGILFLRQALQFAPDNEKCRSLFKKLKQLKEIREEANKLYASSSFARAKDLNEKCLEILKDNTPNPTIESKINFNLSKITHRCGEFEESLKLANRALDLNPSYFKALVHRASVYQAQEMFDESVRDLETAQKLDPTDKSVRSALQRAKLEAAKAKRKDYYKILNVNRNASEDEIRKAYKKRALMHHPDRHASATDEERKQQEKQFKEVGEAYEILSDPKKRARYDSGQDINDINGHGDFGFDPHQVFNVFFGNPRGAGRQTFHTSAGGSNEFHHFF